MVYLNDTLRDLPLPESLPIPLPLAHLTLTRHLNSIITDGYLKPKRCGVFGRDLLYFSYGGISYSPKSFMTRNPMELPVAFLFSPKLLNVVAHYYPCDSGAAHNNQYGDVWSSELQNFNKYTVNGDQNNSRRNNLASKMVHYVYGSNANYIGGEVIETCQEHPEPLPTLYQFFQEDMSEKGIDERQTYIECQLLNHISIAESIVWIGYPEKYTDMLMKILELTDPEIPEHKTYSYHRNFNPQRATERLKYLAQKFVEERFLRAENL